MKSFIPHVQFILIKPPKIIHLEKMTDDKCQSPKELDFINMNAWDEKIDTLIKE